MHFKDINWELVVVDWNPPSSKELISDSKLFEKYSEIPVRHVVHSPLKNSINPKDPPFKLHEAINLGITESVGTFCIISNFDCLFSEGIFKTIGEKGLKLKHLYLADRMDVSLIKNSDWVEFGLEVEGRNFKNLEKRPAILNVRHSKDSFGRYQPITIKLPEDKAKIILGPNKFEYIFGNLAIWKRVTKFRFRLFMKWSSLKVNSRNQNSFTKVIEMALSKYGIHTNGSGDFILAPRQTLIDVNGLSLIPQQYWHLDSDLIFKLLKVGLKHCTFVYPSRIVHLTSIYSGGNDSRYQNKMSYEEMCERWVKMWR